jgi:hypothetical protein
VQDASRPRAGPSPPDQIHKELLRDIHAGDTAAIGELRELHPEPIEPTAAKLSDAQLVLARSYNASSWPRLAPVDDPVRHLR